MTLGPLKTSCTFALHTAAVAGSRGEAASLGQTDPHHIIPSTEPPLTARQVEGLQQYGGTAIDYYEQAVPSIKDLRRRARDLAQETAHLNPDNAAENLHVAKRRMALEGELLSRHPHLSFHDAGYLLDLNQMAIGAPRVLHAESLNELEDRLSALFSGPSEALPSHAALRNTLDQGLSDIAKHLEGHEAFYHQVLQGELSDTERKHIEAGHRALVHLADHWASAAERLLGQCHAQSSKRLHRAQASLSAIQVLSTTSDSQEAEPVSSARQAVEHWQAVANYFKMQSLLLGQQGPLVVALQHVHLDDHVESLNAARRGLFTQLLSSIGAGVSEGVAASLQYLLARAYVPSDSQEVNIAAQSIINGLAIGATHETLDNFAKPATQEIISSLGIREPCHVAVTALIPDAPRATVLNGRYHEYSDTQWAIAQNHVEQARAGLRNAQQDYKGGSLKGDVLTFINLPGVQMIRQAVELTPSVNRGTLAAQALASFGGKFVASFSQAQGQLRKTYRHDARDLPTHTPHPAPDESLLKRLGQCVRTAAPSIDPRERKMRTSYASKIWSGSEGMLAFNGVGRAMVKLDTSTRAGAVCSILLTGVQTLGLQMPFEANKRSGAEAEADNTDRVRSAIANVLDPDRPTLAHGTQMGTIERQLENVYNRTRGVEQLPAQIATVITEAVLGMMVNGLRSVLNTTTRQLNSLRSSGPAVVSPDLEADARR